MYSFLRRPRYILFTLAIVGAIVGMIELGFWQLRRLDERRATNAAVEQHLAQEPVPVTTVLRASDDVAAAKQVEWTIVTAEGTYDLADQVLVRNRTFDGQPGFHVLTPLLLGDGTALVVNRGWIPLEREHDVPLPASGDVTVTGRLRPSQQRQGIGPRDPSEGVLGELARADLVRLQQQVEPDLFPGYVEIISQIPALASGPPEPVLAPDLSEGPHLSYAVQWFAFCVLAAIGWVAVVRKTARDRLRAAAESSDPDPADVADPLV